MKAVIQRVSQAKVEVDQKIVGKIEKGWLVYLGVGKNDTEKEVESLAKKIFHLRGFEDENHKLNRSLQDIQGSMLIVSQFTLYGDCHKGRRPSFDESASPEMAKRLYENFCQTLRELGCPFQTGIFQAQMKVSSINEGPVTFVF